MKVFVAVMVLLGMAMIAIAGRPTGGLPPPPEIVEVVESIPIPWDTVWVLEHSDSCGQYGDTLYPTLFIFKLDFDTHVLAKELDRHQQALERALIEVHKEATKRKRKP